MEAATRAYVTDSDKAVVLTADSVHLYIRDGSRWISVDQIIDCERWGGL